MMKAYNQDFFWEIAYYEDFYGLQDLPAYNVINEYECQKLHTVV